jgi:hypothetical protein
MPTSPVEQRSNTLHQRGPTSSRTGKNSSRAPLGGADASNSRLIDERAPLLSGRDRDGEDDADSRHHRVEYEEYSQWEGLPWYRKPSVCDSYQTEFRV